MLVLATAFIIGFIFLKAFGYFGTDCPSNSIYNYPLCGFYLVVCLVVMIVCIVSYVKSRKQLKQTTNAIANLEKHVYSCIYYKNGNSTESPQRMFNVLCNKKGTTVSAIVEAAAYAAFDPEYYGPALSASSATKKKTESFIVEMFKSKKKKSKKKSKKKKSKKKAEDEDVTEGAGIAMFGAFGSASGFGTLVSTKIDPINYQNVPNKQQVINARKAIYTLVLYMFLNDDVSSRHTKDVRSMFCIKNVYSGNFRVADYMRTNIYGYMNNPSYMNNAIAAVNRFVHLDANTIREIRRLVEQDIKTTMELAMKIDMPNVWNIIKRIDHTYTYSYLTSFLLLTIGTIVAFVRSRS
jgi:hypothetical protein